LAWRSLKQAKKTTWDWKWFRINGTEAVDNTGRGGRGGRGANYEPGEWGVSKRFFGRYRRGGGGEPDLGKMVFFHAGRSQFGETMKIKGPGAQT